LIRSMTGYGRSEQTIDNFDISVEIKSVNHRYSDYNIKVPRYYSFLEEKIKTHLQSFISRGKVDVFVSIYKTVDDSKEIAINPALAKSYIDALRTLAADYNIKDDISVSSVARYTDIFDVKRVSEDEEELVGRTLTVVKSALDGFLEMREREGKKLADDMLMRNSQIREDLKEIEKIAPQTVIEYRQKIEDRIKELLSGTPVDENRLLTETAIYADKLSITEEIIRLHSHLDEFDRIMGLGDAVGRKLDFLLQEMNREINTIGSKSNNIEIAKIVVNVKSELEKIREQLQNIE